MHPLFIALVVVAVLAVTVTVVVLVLRKGDLAPVEPTAGSREATADAGLRARLAKTRSALSSSLSGVFGSESLSDDAWSD
ncbi:MAG: hypothetical protein DRJ28_08580, partial [Actinobacteria bacterium]